MSFLPSEFLLDLRKSGYYVEPNTCSFLMAQNNLTLELMLRK